jgi:hypothetical protein
MVHGERTETRRYAEVRFLGVGECVDMLTSRLQALGDGVGQLDAGARTGDGDDVIPAEWPRIQPPCSGRGAIGPRRCLGRGGDAERLCLVSQIHGQ